MAVQAICTSTIGNLGTMCNKGNNQKALTGLILTTGSFSFATLADFADQTKYEEAVKAKQIFPLMGFKEYDNNSEETQYYESPLGDMIKLRDGKNKYLFRFHLDLNTHKELQKFSNSDLRYFLVDAGNTIYGFSNDGTTVKGFSISNFEAEKQMRATADAPAWSPVSIVEQNSSEWDQNGIQVTPNWIAEDLGALANVLLVTSGTPSATEIIVEVGYPTGAVDSTGVLENVPVLGIDQADFIFKKASDGSAQVPTGMTDNSNGTYTFQFAALETGTVDLTEPSLMVSTGLLIEAIGPASYTI
jgi:hypothetical protein